MIRNCENVQRDQNNKKMKEKSEVLLDLAMKRLANSKFKFWNWSISDINIARLKWRNVEIAIGMESFPSTWLTEAFLYSYQLPSHSGGSWPRMWLFLWSLLDFQVILSWDWMKIIMLGARNSCGFLYWGHNLHFVHVSELQHNCTCCSQSNTLLYLTLLSPNLLTA
jgi:hypothetical protein